MTLLKVEVCINLSGDLTLTLHEGSCEFIGGSSSRYVTTMISLETISVVIVEMFLNCQATTQDHMFKGLRGFMSGSP